MQTIDMPTPKDGSRAAMVIGRVVRIHVADEVITDEGMIDISQASSSTMTSTTLMQTSRTNSSSSRPICSGIAR